MCRNTFPIGCLPEAAVVFDGLFEVYIFEVISKYHVCLTRRGFSNALPQITYCLLATLEDVLRIKKYHGTHCQNTKVMYRYSGPHYSGRLMHLLRLGRPYGLKQNHLPK